jgi:hypothetical protein
VKKLIAAAFAIIISLVAVTPAYTDHNANGILPLIPNTPAVRKLMEQGYLNHCVNQRIATYPGFLGQLDEALDAAAERMGNDVYILPGVFTNVDSAKAAGCDVWHDGRDDNFCQGCAADVMYANYPVHVRYKMTLGYVYWISTIGHEDGHIYGMHEAYDDRAFTSHILKYGSWASPWDAATVMDTGTHVLPTFSPKGVWALTTADKKVAGEWLYAKPVQFVGTNFGFPPNIYWRGVDTETQYVTVIYWQEEFGYWWGSNELKDKPGHYVDCVDGRWIGIQSNNALWRGTDNTVWISCSYILGGS